MSKLPHWFDQFILVGSLDRVSRKGGVTTITLDIQDCAITVGVPDDATQAAELGAELERLGSILREPPPEGQIGLAHVVITKPKGKGKGKGKETEPPAPAPTTAADRTLPLMPAWVRQQLRDGETPDQTGAGWWGVSPDGAERRLLRGELVQVPREFEPAWTAAALEEGETAYREILEPWGWYAAKDPTDETTIRRIHEPEAATVPRGELAPAPILPWMDPQLVEGEFAWREVTSPYRWFAGETVEDVRQLVPPSAHEDHPRGELIEVLRDRAPADILRQLCETDAAYRETTAPFRWYAVDPKDRADEGMLRELYTGYLERPTPEASAAAEPPPEPPKRGRGRPKGSKTRKGKGVTDGAAP